MPRTPGDPRNGTPYRRAVAQCLANSDRCHICGHGQARTADHLISVRDWYAMHGTYAGVNDPANLAPAHGSGGPIPNPCPTCGQNCNQLRGASTLHAEAHSEDW